MMKRNNFLYVVLLILISIANLAATEKFIFSSIRNTEATHDFEIVEEYRFDENPAMVKLTRQTSTNSGTLSSARIRDKEMEKDTFINFNSSCRALQQKEFSYSLGDDAISLAEVSPHGEYYLIRNRLEPWDGKSMHTKSEYSLYNKSGQKMWDYTRTEIGIGKLSDKGTLVYTKNNNNTINVIDKNGQHNLIIEKIFNDESMEKKHPFSLGSSNYLSSTEDKVITFVFEDITDFGNNKERYTYLNGGVIYISDTKGNLLKTIPVMGIKRGGTDISTKGNYFYVSLDDKAALYNLNSGNKISALDAPSTGQRVFSEDETIALIGGNVIDLEKEEIIKWISTGDKVAIADKGYPIVAFTQAYEFFVVDYEKEEILFREDLSDRKYHGPCHNIQISGDGKEVSVVFRDLYRKYRIGGRK